ncbi:hypothetical protein RUM43_002583 [Polyplax serrata]|uniref:Uncharacterized protein n=1 Tax=Polyplax serrata TaxID=468196 RepID=A0AAN8PMK8_POLSC
MEHNDEATNQTVVQQNQKKMINQQQQEEEEQPEQFTWYSSREVELQDFTKPGKVRGEGVAAR